VTRPRRELALVAIVAALLLTFSVQLRRAEPSRAPLRMMSFVASPPPVTSRCSRIGFPDTPPRRIVDVEPVYPRAARRAHASGTVIIEADIDEHGDVSNAHVIRSVPLLDRAALDAVAKWQFEPAMLRGEPACVTTSLAVSVPRE